jgi:hypothetical protein
MFICKPAGRFLVIFGERGLDRPLCDVLTDNEFMDTGDVNVDQIHRYFEKEAAWEDKADRVCKILRSGSLLSVSLRKAPTPGRGVCAYSLKIALGPELSIAK